MSMKLIKKKQSKKLSKKRVFFHLINHKGERKYKNLNTFIKIIFFLDKTELKKSNLNNILTKILFKKKVFF